MTTMKSRFAVALAVFCAPLVANATLIEITATNNGPAGTNGAFSGFSIVYDDTGDGLFQLEELVSFSGVDELGFLLREYTTLSGTPDIVGVSTASGFSLISGSSQFWYFETTPSSGPDGWLAARWTYEVSAAAVPAPGALALLGLGLLGLIGRRLRES